MLEKRFGVKDVPAGWCFIPIAEGGLGIVNPIVNLLTVRPSFEGTFAPEEAFEKCKVRDKDLYEGAKTRWLAGEGEGKGEIFLRELEQEAGRLRRIAFP